MASLVDDGAEGTRRTKIRRQRRKGKRAAARAKKSLGENAGDPALVKSAVEKDLRSLSPRGKTKAWIARQGGESEEDIADEVCDYILNIVKDTTVELEDIKELLVGLDVAPSFSKMENGEQSKQVEIFVNELRGANVNKEQKNAASLSKPGSTNAEVENKRMRESLRVAVADLRAVYHT